MYKSENKPDALCIIALKESNFKLFFELLPCVADASKSQFLIKEVITLARRHKLPKAINKVANILLYPIMNVPMRPLYEIDFDSLSEDDDSSPEMFTEKHRRRLLDLCVKVLIELNDINSAISVTAQQDSHAWGRLCEWLLDQGYVEQVTRIYHNVGSNDKPRVIRQLLHKLRKSDSSTWFSWLNEYLKTLGDNVENQDPLIFDATRRALKSLDNTISLLRAMDKTFGLLSLLLNLLVELLIADRIVEAGDLVGLFSDQYPSLSHIFDGLTKAKNLVSLNVLSEKQKRKCLNMICKKVFYVLIKLEPLDAFEEFKKLSGGYDDQRSIIHGVMKLLEKADEFSHLLEMLFLFNYDDQLSLLRRLIQCDLSEVLFHKFIDKLFYISPSYLLSESPEALAFVAGIPSHIVTARRKAVLKGINAENDTKFRDVEHVHLSHRKYEDLSQSLNDLLEYGLFREAMELAKKFVQSTYRDNYTREILIQATCSEVFDSAFDSCRLFSVEDERVSFEKFFRAYEKKQYTKALNAGCDLIRKYGTDINDVNIPKHVAAVVTSVWFTNCVQQVLEKQHSGQALKIFSLAGLFRLFPFEHGSDANPGWKQQLIDKLLFEYNTKETRLVRMVRSTGIPANDNMIEALVFSLLRKGRFDLMVDLINSFLQEYDQSFEKLPTSFVNGIPDRLAEAELQEDIVCELLRIHDKQLSTKYIKAYLNPAVRHCNPRVTTILAGVSDESIRDELATEYFCVSLTEGQRGVTEGYLVVISDMASSMWKKVFSSTQAGDFQDAIFIILENNLSVTVEFLEWLVDCILKNHNINEIFEMLQHIYNNFVHNQRTPILALSFIEKLLREVLQLECQCIHSELVTFFIRLFSSGLKLNGVFLDLVNNLLKMLIESGEVELAIELITSCYNQLPDCFKPIAKQVIAECLKLNDIISADLLYESFKSHIDLCEWNEIKADISRAFFKKRVFKKSLLYAQRIEGGDNKLRYELGLKFIQELADSRKIQPIKLYLKFLMSDAEEYYHGMIIRALVKNNYLKRAEEILELKIQSLTLRAELKVVIHEKGHHNLEEIIGSDRAEDLNNAWRIYGEIKDDLEREELDSMQDLKRKNLIGLLREQLDKGFLAFYLKHFPDSPKLNDKFKNIFLPIRADLTEENCEELIQQHFDKQLKIPQFKDVFPKLFKFICDIQPAINTDFFWLRCLIELTNQKKHGYIITSEANKMEVTSLPLNPVIDGIKVSMAEFLPKAIQGIQSILVALHMLSVSDQTIQRRILLACCSRLRFPFFTNMALTRPSYKQFEYR